MFMESHTSALSPKRAALEDLLESSKRPAYSQPMSNLPTIRIRNISPSSYVSDSVPASRESSVEYESRWEAIREQITPQNVKTLQAVLGSTGNRMFLSCSKGETLPPFTQEDFYRAKALISQYKSTKNPAVFDPYLFERLRDQAFALRRVASWEALRHTRASFSDVEIVDMGEEFETLSQSAYRIENGKSVRIRPVIPSDEYLAGFYKRYGIEASFVKKWFANAQNRDLPSTYKKIMARSRCRYLEQDVETPVEKVELKKPYHPLVFRDKHGYYPSDGKLHQYDLSTQRNNVPVSLAPKIYPSGVNGKRHPSQPPIRQSVSPPKTREESPSHVDHGSNDTGPSKISTLPSGGSSQAQSSEEHTARILLGLSSARPALPFNVRRGSVPMRSTATPRNALSPVRNIRARGRVWPNTSAVRSTLPPLWFTVPSGRVYDTLSTPRSIYDEWLIMRLNKSL